MLTLWFQHLKDPAERDRFKKDVESSEKVLDRLKEICYTKVKVESSLEDYDSPSWAYRQADQLGYNRAIKEIMEICSISDKER